MVWENRAIFICQGVKMRKRIENHWFKKMVRLLSSMIKNLDDFV